MSEDMLNNEKVGPIKNIILTSMLISSTSNSLAGQIGQHISRTSSVSIWKLRKINL